MAKQEQSEKHFLGEVYYVLYKRIIRIVIPCVAFGTALGWLVEMIREPNVYWYMDIGIWIGITVGRIVGACIMLALILLSMEKLHIPIQVRLGESLVESKQVKGRNLKRTEALSSILFGAFFTLTFLLAPQLLCGIFEGGKEVIPVFNVTFIQTTWYMVVIMWGLDFARSLCRLIYAQYNNVVLVVTLLTNLGIGWLTTNWLRSGQLINVAFVEKIISIVQDEEVLLTYLFTNSSQFLSAIICFGLVINVLNTVIKTINSSGKGYTYQDKV